MTHPTHLRDKALELRVEKRLTIDEIAERLLLPRGTIYHWVRELPPIDRKGRGHPGQRKGNRAMRAKYARLREEAYEEGLASYDELVRDPLFRDFLCMYVREGYKRDRNTVALGNSDPRVVVLAQHHLLRFSRRALSYRVQYHADQDLEELCAFWAHVLAVPPLLVKAQRKSNGGALSGRTCRSVHGVLTVTTRDTSLRARLRAWLDRLQAEWIRSPDAGRGAAW